MFFKTDAHIQLFFSYKKTKNKQPKIKIQAETLQNLAKQPFSHGNTGSVIVITKDCFHEKHSKQFGNNKTG